MEHKPSTWNITAKNQYCVYCLLIAEEWTEAEFLLWDEENQKTIPLCNDCLEIWEGEKNFFNIFSLS
jgi:hypothetical protein